MDTIFVGYMAIQASYFKKTFHFSFKARTSRGSMLKKDSWFLKVWDDKDPEVYGLGEAGPVAGLSREKPEMVERQFSEVVKVIAKNGTLPPTLPLHLIRDYFKPLELFSSVTLAIETACLDLKNGGKRIIFDNDFLKGKPIPINGLVWMGGLDFMLQQVSIKIDDGFSCIKLKIGGINFEKEVDILQFIRRKYFKDTIALRLDANGAFKPGDALYKLMDCSRFDVDSIEQPLPPGSSHLPELCKKTPIPIAIDEEMIGVETTSGRRELLEKIMPQLLVLKPSLHGGLSGCQEWISIAEELKIGWWITSALESNIGLNAVAQFVSQYPLTVTQGLGTGALYVENIQSPLEVKRGALVYNSQENWDLSEFN